MFSKKAVISLAAVSALAIHSQVWAGGSGGTNYYGGHAAPKAAVDHTVPIQTDGYIVPSSEPIPGGAKITVEIFHRENDTPVSLWLQAAINDGTGKTDVIPLAQLSYAQSDNPALFYSKREFQVSYDSLNKEMETLAPKAHLKIGPGSPLFVYAMYNPQLGTNGSKSNVGGKWSHQWGGTQRGGLVFMPEENGTAVVQQDHSGVGTSRPTALDLAFPISQTLANQYNDRTTGAGLKVGGQVRSRMESEGKFQVNKNEVEKIKKELFAIANDPAKAATVLGPDWTIVAELKYMKKDASGQMILDAEGLPTPDPMVDTYYDNDHFDAAKKDMAIRYRWTEGNQTGNWNFKPGMRQANASGVVDRLEFGIDATDDKPETIMQFADSSNPLNPLKIVREVIPGAKPSDFLKPAVKLTDIRYKFSLRNKNGFLIEVSLDNVLAESLRTSKTSTFTQMEMDVEHLATQSANTVQNGNVSKLMHSDPRDVATQAFLTNLDDKAFFDGRPVLHDFSDLKSGSALKTAHEDDFKLADQAIIALRDHLLGKNWVPGAQKYAWAAASLEHLTYTEFSNSVKRVGDEKARHAIHLNIAQTKTVGMGSCGSLFE